jgi:hypothetical protein
MFTNASAADLGPGKFAAVVTPASSQFAMTGQET